MEGLSTKSEQSGISVNDEAQGSYETGKGRSWKTWHGIPLSGTKGGVNKGRRYTSTYETGVYRNTTDEI